jgi:enoyl-CoA hydratase
VAVHAEHRDRILVVTIDRLERRNAVDAATAVELIEVFEAFDADGDADVAVLTGAGGTFSSGADLKALTDPDAQVPPMGPTHIRLAKPTIAAVEGYAVGGGFELALWCDLRVVADGAAFGAAHRRWGLPTIDGGTFRLPRIVGQSRALDLLLTGRFVAAPEADRMGLITRLVPQGQALDIAIELARDLSALAQPGIRHDRLAVLEQWGLDETDAITNEIHHAGVIADTVDFTTVVDRSQS